MQALELLLNRRSQPRLSDPAPAGEALENILQAALRAPDHAGLKPWEFVICAGQGRERLGELFVQASIADGADDKTLERAPQLPLRAPMVIAAICRYTEHPKVPRVEQVASTACAVQAMQMAAVAQGFQGIWRTGSYAQHPVVRAGFELAEQDELVGFLYLGSASVKPMPAPKVNSAEFFQYWD